MGWKNVKEHYRIGHTVQVTDKGICIGSLYIHDLIVVGLDGKTICRYDENSNKDLHRYQQEFDADPAMLRHLIETPDVFATSTPVYTYKGGDIIEKQCETPGWPNITHDGEIMYKNLFSEDRATVISWARQNAESNIASLGRRIKDAENQLFECRCALELEIADLSKLESIHSETPSP